MTIAPFLPVILVGSLRADYVITRQGKSLVAVPGGHLFYTALGLHFCEKQFGIVSRVGSNFPESPLELLRSYGIDIRGVKRTPEPIDYRFFIHYDPNNEKDFANPLAHFAAERIPLPKALLGYELKTRTYAQLFQRDDETIVYRDIPADYLDSTFIHICPHDFLTQMLIPQSFRQSGTKRITLRAAPEVMIPQFLPKFGSLINGLSAFFCDESEIQSLFQNSIFSEFRKQVSALASLGAETIVVFRKDDVFLYEAKRDEALTIPFFSKTVENRTGLKDAFCGGFIGALMKSYSYREALAGGVAAASFVSESTDPLYALDTVMGLYDARRTHLVGEVREVVVPAEVRKWRRFSANRLKSDTID